MAVIVSGIVTGVIILICSLRCSKKVKTMDMIQSVNLNIISLFSAIYIVGTH